MAFLKGKGIRKSRSRGKPPRGAVIPLLSASTRRYLKEQGREHIERRKKLRALRAAAVKEYPEHLLKPYQIWRKQNWTDIRNEIAARLMRDCRLQCRRCRVKFDSQAGKLSPRASWRPKFKNWELKARQVKSWQVDEAVPFILHHFELICARCRLKTERGWLVI